MLSMAGADALRLNLLLRQVFSTLSGRILALHMGYTKIFDLNEGRESFASPHSEPGYGLTVCKLLLICLSICSFFSFLSNIFSFLACLPMQFPCKVNSDVPASLTLNDPIISPPWDKVGDRRLVSIPSLLLHG